MGATTGIEWTDASCTPIKARYSFEIDGKRLVKTGWHCEHVSEACRFCYAEGINHRFGTGLDFKPGHLKDVEIYLDEKLLTDPLRWKRPRKIFICSMTDLFADFVREEWIDRIFAMMAMCPRHIFQILTKRPERMRAYMTAPDTERRVGRRLHDDAPRQNETIGFHFTEIAPRGFHGCGIVGVAPWPLPHVWLGTSVEDQSTADERIPYLLQTPAALRFLSCEPLLGPIDLASIIRRATIEGHTLEDGKTHPIGWVICGGESGPQARPSNPQWFRDLRDQCDDAGVPFHFKQNGEWVSVSEVEGPGEHYTFPDHRSVRRVGRKKAGRTLDGREHNGFPRAIA